MASSSSSLTAYDPDLSRNATSSPPKLVRFDEIQTILANLLSSREGVDAILSSQVEAFRLAASSPSKCASLPIQTAGQIPYPSLAAGPAAQVCIKSGYAVDDSVLVSKCAAGGGKYSGNTGSVSVYDQKTLRLKAVLCDEGLLTEVRTAAAATCATRAAILAAGRGVKVEKVGLIGGGVQAIWNLRLLGASGTIDPAQVVIVVKTTSRESAETFIQKMRASPYQLDRQFTMECYNGTSKFKECQVIHTLTPSRCPVLNTADVSLPKDGHGRFLHISAVGSDSPGKCEISVDLLKEADFCLVDSLSQTIERGEFQPQRWSDRYDISFELVEIGSQGTIDDVSGILMSKKVDPNRPLFSIFDSSGLAIQDVQMAKLISQYLE